MVFIRLDYTLRCVDAVVCRFYELPLAILLLEESSDGLGALVIGDVKGRFVPLSIRCRLLLRAGLVRILGAGNVAGIGRKMP